VSNGGKSAGSPPDRLPFSLELKLPLLAIQHQPWFFLEWLLTAVVVGSVGVWLVPLLGLGPSTAWYDAIATGSLTSFCIVLLADLSSWSFPVSARLSGRPVDHPKHSASIIAFILVLIQVGILVALAAAKKDATPRLVGFQIVLLILTLTIASYLVCFRLRDLDPTAAEVEARENAEVKNLDVKAATITKTSEGEEL
jgi:hypothetical protein